MASPETGIIILSGPKNEQGDMSHDTVSRLQAGKLLWAETGLPLILVGGSSELMYDQVGEWPDGPAEEDVYKEIRSRDTVGNALYTKTGITQPEGFEAAHLVTADYHIQRANYVFRRVLGPLFDIRPHQAETKYNHAERQKLRRSEILYRITARAALLGYDPETDDELLQSRVESIASTKRFIARLKP